MFGYVQYDKPNLYIKDFELYRAMYCGVCKGIGATCGQIARTGLSYDAAFLNTLFHNLKNTDVVLEKQSCITKFGFKHPMAAVDDLTKAVGCLNTILLYYKLTDDIADEKKGGLRRAFFKKGYNRAKQLHPQMAEIVDRNMRLQAEREKSLCDSLDLAADATATMLQQIGRYLLEEYATEHTDALLYDIGKWIYLIDAVDDYDKDVKQNSYNPFFLAYGSQNKATLVKDHGNELRFLFNTLFFDIRERMSNIKFYFNRDLTDNILLKGLPLRTEWLVFKQPCPKQKGKCKSKQKVNDKELEPNE